MFVLSKTTPNKFAFVIVIEHVVDFLAIYRKSPNTISHDIVHRIYIIRIMNVYHTILTPLVSQTIATTRRRIGDNPRRNFVVNILCTYVE